MARVFTGSSSLYLTASSSPVSDEPLTMSIWVYPTDLTSDWSGYFVLANSARTQYYQIRTLSYFDYRPMFQAGGASSSGYSLHGTLMSTNAWQHLAGVATSASERVVYRNGVTATPNYTNIGTATPTLTDVGAGLLSGSRTRYARGWLAHAAVWNVALTSTEVLALSRGASPFIIRPEGLVAYWPITGRLSPEHALAGDTNLTVAGSPAYADSPSVYRRPKLLKPQDAPVIPPSFSIDAVIFKQMVESIGFDAAVKVIQQGNFTVDATLEVEIFGDYQPRPGVSLSSGGVFMI